MGRCTHRLNAGVIGAHRGVLAPHAVVAQADRVLFIGCRAGSTTTEHWKFPARDVPILHLDADPMAIGTNYRTDVAMVGDALLGLSMLPARAIVKAWTVSSPADLEAAIKAALLHDGPALVGVISQELQDTAVPVTQWMG